MDCRRFRHHHLAFLDDTLPGDLVDAVEAHLVRCSDCRSHDTQVRRSLLLARNLPPIECSRDFTARLEARLQEVRGARPVREQATWEDEALDAGFLVRQERTTWRPGRRTAAVAASLLLAGWGGAAWRGGQAGAPPAGTGPMTAAQQAVPAAPRVNAGDVTLAAQAPPAAVPTPAEQAPNEAALATPSLAASAMMVPAGVPVWPAAILAGELPTELLRGVPRRRGGHSGVELVRLER